MKAHPIALFNNQVIIEIDHHMKVFNVDAKNPVIKK